MSEDAPEVETQDDSEGSEPVKPEVDWKAKAREWEKRAKENFGAKAELDKIRESQKTAEQKLTERAEAAERRAQDLEVSSMRTEIALEHGLSAKDARRLIGSTREELTADAAEMAAERGAGKPQGDIGQGHRPEAKSNDMNQVIRDLINR